LLGYKL